MSFATGEIILVPIPFTDLASRKVRPAIIIGFGSYPGDLFVVPISSQLYQTDFPLADWLQSGLNVPCGVKSQITTIASRMVLKTIGKITPNDRSSLEKALRGWLQL